MARGTRLFQNTGSPLIQGRSRHVRPWWQPYLLAVFLGLVWPIASMLPHEIAEAGGGAFNTAMAATLRAWLAGLPTLVPAVLVGAAIGVGLGGMWAVRFRWVPGAAAAIGAWYAALILVGLFG